MPILPLASVLSLPNYPYGQKIIAKHVSHHCKMILLFLIEKFWFARTKTLHFLRPVKLRFHVQIESLIFIASAQKISSNMTNKSIYSLVEIAGGQLLSVMLISKPHRTLWTDFRDSRTNLIWGPFTAITSWSLPTFHSYHPGLMWSVVMKCIGTLVKQDAFLL